MDPSEHSLRSPGWAAEEGRREKQSRTRGTVHTQKNHPAPQSPAIKTELGLSDQGAAAGRI